MKRLWLLAALLTIPVFAVAQDRSGANTASDWVVTNFKPFGLWDSMCDERMEAGALRQRCYLRYVEAYSPHPKFLAVFAFVYPENGDSIVEFGFERGTRYAADGFRVEKGGETVWQFSGECLNSGKCVFIGSKAESMLNAFADGAELIQVFRDRYGDQRSLSWDLSGFAKAFEDYRQSAAARSLL